MHVADVTMFYAPQGGGVRRYIEAKRAWLQARGISHHLVVPLARNHPPQPGLVPVPSVPLPWSHGYRVPTGTNATVRALVALAPTIIEAGDPYHPAWAALQAAERLSVPAVAFCHSDLPRMMSLRLGPHAERLVARYYARMYRHFDLVLAPSRTMTARLRHWGILRARHQPLGVDIDVFHPGARDPRLREQLGIAARTRLIVFAGRLAREKNLDVLTAALRQLGDGYTALIVGAGTSPRDLPSNARVLPYIAERAALASLLASCDLFVHPGDQETFGLAVIEALACGLPVVGADAAGVAEVVTPAVGTLVRPRDPHALAEAIAATFDRDRARLGANARLLAHRYAWDRVLPELLAQYAALVARAAARERPRAALGRETRSR
jgi:alpha-1,6-mannosyltransferase